MRRAGCCCFCCCEKAFCCQVRGVNSRLWDGMGLGTTLDLVCVCEPANVRDPQDHAPFARQSYFDTLPCEVLLSSHERQCQNTQSNRSSHNTSALVTWRRRGAKRQLDDLTSWGLNSLCTVSFSFSDIPRKTTKSIPTVDIPSAVNIHASKPCSFHDSISGHDENAAGSRGAQDTDQHTALVALHLQLLLLPPAR